MAKTSLIYHPDYLKHDISGHCECKERLIRTMDFFQEKGVFDFCKLVTPKPCTEEDILRCHTPEHLNYIKSLCAQGGGAIDGDTYAQPQTYEIARLAAGGDITAGQRVMSGKSDNAYALVRPPGHHACKNHTMGFCYFNNAAIMVRLLQEDYGLERVFLFDWDAHAANGTMDIFRDDPTVLNVSIHQDPHYFYPGTGFVEQTGEGDGEGYTINVPVQAGSADVDYTYLLDKFVLPVLDDFEPELIVISAGMDSHKDDPISGLRLSDNAYGKMTEIFMKVAKKHCNGRLIIELEGGYDVDALARSNYNIVRALQGEKFRNVRGPVLASTLMLARKLKETFGKYHDIK